MIGSLLRCMLIQSDLLVMSKAACHCTKVLLVLPRYLLKINPIALRSSGCG